MAVVFPGKIGKPGAKASADFPSPPRELCAVRPGALREEPAHRFAYQIGDRALFRTRSLTKGARLIPGELDLHPNHAIMVSNLPS